MNTKSKESIYFIIEKKKLKFLAFQCLEKTQCCTLIVSVKGC